MSTTRDPGPGGKTYDAPANLVQLLDGVVGAAAGARFYREAMGGRPAVSTLAEFGQLPITPVSAYRALSLSDVVAEPDRVQWIVGRRAGRLRGDVAVAEGTKETAARYELLKDALRDAAPGFTPKSCAVITSGDRRYYAAEVSTILGYLGIPAHVFTENGTARSYELAHLVGADMAALLTDGFDESLLPGGVRLCLTFRGSHRLERCPQLDLYMVDELGFLGHSADLESWVLYNDQYFFEESEGHRLVVTALHNRVQPLLRLETHDTVSHLGRHSVRLRSICRCG